MAKAQATVPSKKAKGREIVPIATDGVEREKSNTVNYSNMMQAAYSKRVDAVDKSLGLNFSLTKQPILSTGLLSLDLTLGKGLPPGMSIYFGAEASAKSTACVTTLKESLKKPIAVRKYFDPENAVDARYTCNIVNVSSLSDIFGDRNKSGRWTIPPKCTYHDENITETVFSDILETIRFMPRKVYHPQLNEWFLVFSRERDSMAFMKELIAAKVVGEPSKALFSSTSRYWCSVGDDDSPQGIFFIDSFPQLTPEKMDKNDGGKGLALKSRVLGEHMGMVRGKLRSRGIMVLGVNQMRDRPMPGPGQSDWYEPSGNAIKFNSDARSMFSSVGVQEDFPKWKDHGGICAEDSVEFDGGKDLYAFKNIRNIKNKYGIPFRKTCERIWYKDGENQPRGFDPVFDCFKFLRTVGAMDSFVPSCVTNQKKKFRIDLKPIMDEDFTWNSFKAMVIGEYDNNNRMRKAAYEMGAPAKFGLLKYCRKLLDSGKTEDMLASYTRSREKAKGDGVDLEAESEGDDGEE